VFTQFVFGFARVLILLAFYRVSSGGGALDLAGAVNYVWLGQMFLRLMPRGDAELDEEVRSGQVAYNLLRPVPLLGQFFARSLANRMSSVTLRFLPFLPVVLILPAPYRLGLPVSLSAGLFWAGSMLLAAALGAAINCALSSFCFRSVMGDGARLLVSAGSMLLAGITVPLPLLPDGLQAALIASPFAGLSDLPIRLYTGVLPVRLAPLVLGLQAFWIAAFLAVAHWQLRRNLKTLDILGG
jgi:ABC-2 type transport system permease protein